MLYEVITLPTLAEITLALPSGSVPAAADHALREASATADGVALARTLGNLPSNICTPGYLADEARKLGRVITSYSIHYTKLYESGCGRPSSSRSCRTSC